MEWSEGGKVKIMIRLTYGYSDNGVGDEQLFLPVQDQAAGKMAPGLDGCHPGQHFFGHALGAGDESQRLGRRRLLTEPFLVFDGYVNGTVENLGPDCVGGVVMRM